MARTKTKTQDVVDVALNGEVLAAVQHAAVERTGDIIARFGDGLPFEELRYEHVIRSHLSRSAEEMLAAGRALIVAKEHLGHGDWMPFIERIGLENRLSQRMMQAAFKFSNASTSTHLIEAVSSKSKLFELLVLDEGEIKELSDGGTVAGLELDDIVRMSVSELRKALREEREEVKAKDQVLASRNAKLDQVEAELDRAKTRMQSATPDEAVVALRTEFGAHVHGVVSTLGVTLRDGIRQLQDMADPDNSTPVFISTSLAQIKAAIDTLCADLGVTATTSQVPVWATEE